MKNAIRRSVQALLFACATVSGSTLAAQAEQEVKLAYCFPEASHYGAGARAWTAAIEEGTDGKFKVRHFSSCALGGERDTVEGLQFGTIEAIMVSTGTLSNFVPEVGLTDIPFLFRDLAHARTVLDGPIGDEIRSKFDDRGIVALAWGEQGFRHITNNTRPIHKPADLGALEQGTIDGQENPLSVIVSANIDAVQKYLTLSGHVYSPTMLLVSKPFYDGLSDEEKAVFRDGALAGAAAMRNFVDEAEQTGIATLKERGMQVNELSAEERAAFQASVQSAYEEYYKTYDKALIDKVIETK
jgi:TRAP-type C4-dicarboxylate transport system substrate-binding protein